MQGFHSIQKSKQSSLENKLHLKTIFSRNLKQKFVGAGRCLNANLVLIVLLLTESTSCTQNRTSTKTIEQDNAKTSTNTCTAPTAIDVSSTTAFWLKAQKIKEIASKQVSTKLRAYMQSYNGQWVKQKTLQK
jgi:hypothetical protein